MAAYSIQMKTSPSSPLMRTAVVAALAAGFSIVGGVAFAAWLDKGDNILMALGSSALAWCF
jgi:hypothetical protein